MLNLVNAKLLKIKPFVFQEVEDRKKDMCHLKETKDREQEVLRMENKKKVIIDFILLLIL